MIFCEKLDKALSVAHVKGAVLSRLSGLDPSLISRFRSGDRKPPYRGEQISAISSALASAVSADYLPDLCALAGCECDRNAVVPALLEWFNMPDSALAPKYKFMPGERVSSRTGYITDFSEKLDILMSALDISNVRLARQLNVDASLVSRLRGGSRRVNADSDFIGRLSSYFASYAVSTGKSGHVMHLIGAYSEVPVYKLKEYLSETINVWLLNAGLLTASRPLHSFLEQFDIMEPVETAPAPVAIPEFEKGHISTAEMYEGIKGLKTAFLRFTAMLLERDEPSDVIMYSTLPVDSVIDDRETMTLWNSMMLQLMMRGTRVRVVHNMDRSTTEIIESSLAWLPMYMTGKVESRASRLRQDRRVVSIAFAAKGYIAVSGFSMQAGVDKAGFLLHTDANEVESCMLSLESVWDTAVPLINTFDQYSVNKLLARLPDFQRLDGDTGVLQYGLPVAVMPPDLMRRILERSSIEKAHAKLIYNYTAESFASFKEAVKKHAIVEYMFLPTREEITEGRALISIPSFFGAPDIYYTPEEYREHCLFILSLMTQNPMFSAEILNDAPLPNVHITLKKDKAALVMRAGRPPIVFMTDNRNLVSALQGYLGAAAHSSYRFSADRESFVKMFLPEE